jgi:hypothetical protein
MHVALSGDPAMPNSKKNLIAGTEFTMSCGRLELNMLKIMIYVHGSTPTRPGIATAGISNVFCIILKVNWDQEV